ncbi:hypothetical protein LINPERHAP1_LOCUS31729 [Linum perenne]
MPSNSDRFGFGEVHVSAVRRRPSIESRFEDKFVVVSRSAWADPAKKRMGTTENDVRELVSPPPVEKRVVSARSGDRKPVKVSFGGPNSYSMMLTVPPLLCPNREFLLRTPSIQPQSQHLHSSLCLDPFPSFRGLAIGVSASNSRHVLVGAAILVFDDIVLQGLSPLPWFEMHSMVRPVLITWKQTNGPTEAVSSEFFGITRHHCKLFMERWTIFDYSQTSSDVLVNGLLGSPNKDGSEKNVEVEKSTGSHDVANHQEIVGGSNGTATMIREAFVADTVETEKTLKRKKVYEDKGKAKVSELEKEPKKLLFGNKGIVIRVLDEEDSCEKDSSTPKN